MSYVILKDIKENLCRKLQRRRRDVESISARGWNIDEVKIPSELSGILLPVNLLAYRYCSTNRDVFLNRVRGIRQSPTWSSYQGRVIHEVLLKIMKSVRNYVSRPNVIRKMDLLKYARTRGRKLINKATQNIDQEIETFNTKPNTAQKEQFLKNLLKLVRMESEVMSTLVDYAIATNIDINLDSEFSRMFPFKQEISLNATPLGLAPSIKPDFVYTPGEHMIIGEIKTGEAKEFHKIGVAAYAMAYEYEEEIPVNFGIILNVCFSRNRNVPIYRDSEAFVISEKYRKAFLELRDEKLNIKKIKIEPKKPTDQSLCNSCPYVNNC